MTVAMGATDAGRQQRDAGLVAERGKVVHAGQPDDLPPRVGAPGRSGVVLQRFAARQPSADGGLVLERWFGQLLAEGNTRRNLP